MPIAPPPNPFLAQLVAQATAAPLALGPGPAPAIRPAIPYRGSAHSVAMPPVGGWEGALADPEMLALNQGSAVPRALPRGSTAGGLARLTAQPMGPVPPVPPVRPVMPSVSASAPVTTAPWGPPLPSSTSLVAPLVAETVEETAKKALRTGWKSKLLGTGEAGFKAGGGFAGGIGRAATFIPAGFAAGDLIDSFNVGGDNSTLDQVLPGVAKGLGVGATIAPFTGPAAPYVLAASAVIGGAYGYFHDDDDDPGTTASRAVSDTRGRITDLASQWGLDPEATSNVLNEYDSTTQLMLGGQDKKAAAAQIKQYIGTLAAALPTKLLAQKQEQQRFGQMMQMQAQFGPIFTDMAARSSASNQHAYDAAKGAAEHMRAANPEMADILLSQAENSKASADGLLASYAQQITQTGSRANWARQQAMQDTTNQFTAALQQ